MNKTRTQVSEAAVEEAVVHVTERLAERLVEKGFGTFSSSHEVLGIITEEYHELVAAVHVRGGVRSELVDIAVGAIFAVACMDSGTLEW